MTQQVTDEKAKKRMKMQLDLERRVATMNGAELVQLPAEFVAGTLADLRAARDAEIEWLKFKGRVEHLLMSRGDEEQIGTDGKVTA